MVDSRIDPADRVWWLAIGLAVLCVVGVIMAASSSVAAYGPYNSQWDGTSSLWNDLQNNGVETAVVEGQTTYGNLTPNGTAILILSPDEPFDPFVKETLRRYVRNGGTVVIAEDFRPYSNQLLAEIGARARFSGDLLRDERRFSRAPTRPIVGNDSAGRLILNRGTAIEPNGATSVVTTSEFAYLDVNQSGEIDETEELGEYAVVTRERVGNGSIIAIGDPSVFINEMQTTNENRVFVIDLLDEYQRVVFDVTAARDIPPAIEGFILLRQSSAVQTWVGLVGLVIITGWTFQPLTRGKRFIRGVWRTVREMTLRHQVGTDDE